MYIILIYLTGVILIMVDLKHILLSTGMELKIRIWILDFIMCIEIEMIGQDVDGILVMKVFHISGEFHKYHINKFAIQLNL